MVRGGVSITALPLVRYISTMGRLFNLWGFLSAKWDDNMYLVLIYLTRGRAVMLTPPLTTPDYTV